MDWRPNARTGPGPGIEPGLRVAQCRGRTATPPAFLMPPASSLTILRGNSIVFYEPCVKSWSLHGAHKRQLNKPRYYE